MVSCLDQWRHAIVECDDAGLPDQVRDIESVSRMVYSVMLDAVAELESRNIAVDAGFRNTKQLLAGMGEPLRPPRPAPESPTQVSSPRVAR